MRTLAPLLIISMMIFLMIFFLSKIKEQANKVNNLIDQIDQAMSQRIGDTIVVMKDTLLIVDYSVSRKSYIMNNGTELSEKLIETYESNKAIQTRNR